MAITSSPCFGTSHGRSLTRMTERRRTAPMTDTGRRERRPGSFRLVGRFDNRQSFPRRNPPRLCCRRVVGVTSRAQRRLRRSRESRNLKHKGLLGRAPREHQVSVGGRFWKVASGRPNHRRKPIAARTPHASPDRPAKRAIPHSARCCADASLAATLGGCPPVAVDSHR